VEENELTVWFFIVRSSHQVVVVIYMNTKI
jgi:hypothetical protein